jgi:hypothetical protein
LQFNQYAVTIEDSATDLERNMYEAFGSVADSITAYAITSNSTWPFITQPFFEVSGSHARDITHIDLFSFCPLVMESDLAAWESYSVENQWWTHIEDQAVTGTEAQEAPFVLDSQERIPSRVYRFDAQDGYITAELGPAPYGPRWQTSPPPSNLLYVNYDVLSPPNMQALFDYMVVSNYPVMSGILLPTRHALPDTTNNASSDLSSILMFPVYKSFNYTSTDVSGFLEIFFSWKTFLSLLLPEGEGGVYYVLSTSCGDIYTFETTRGETILLGEGDLHDILYDKTVVTVDLITYNYSMGHIWPCNYTVDVYPSSELRHEFATNAPEVFTAIVASAFFLMAFFFFTYDKYVQTRNEKVVRQAAKTNAIVSSLFPTNVRERLFGQDDASKRSGSRTSGRRSLKMFLSDHSHHENQSTGGGSRGDQPIADLFPNCSVLFADIVGKFF